MASRSPDAAFESALWDATGASATFGAGLTALLLPLLTFIRARHE